MPTRCGACGCLVPTGDPLIAFTFPAVHRRLWRCVVCADARDPRPPDLPPLVEPAPIVARPFVHIRAGLDAWPLDFKSRSAGDRQPGEDD